jgi:hypothetical protein
MIRFTLRQAAISVLLLGGAVSSGAVLGSARAEMVISADPTIHMSCSGGVCTPTAKSAVLNASDLQAMLAASDVQITTGAGAKTIAVNSSIAWTSTHMLTLQADLDVAVKAIIAVQGTGGLTIRTGSGGDLVFFPTGRIDFWDTSSTLAINSASYLLAADLPSLKQLIGENVGQNWFALTKDYDAAGDGTYGDSIFNDLRIAFEGLNHTVSNVTFTHVNDSNVGFFGKTESDAVMRDLKIVNATASGGGSTGIAVGENDGAIVNVSTGGVVSDGVYLGGVAGSGIGSIARSSSSAQVVGSRRGIVGGLAGRAGTIFNSHATGAVIPGGQSIAGGLAGAAALVDQSYATGNVGPSRPANVEVLGGLIGDAGNTVSNSYATGAVYGPGPATKAAGLIGYMRYDAVTTSYSTGLVTGPSQDARVKGAGGRWGGFMGRDQAEGNTADYWDIDTSGRTNACGNRCTGVTGVSDAQLKAGLPAGFDPAIWGQSPSINNGYPYLLKSVPQ